VQVLRQKAQQEGKLASTPEEQVSNGDDGEIDIVPSDANVMCVPQYNPVWIWGPALYYPYPGWYWPQPNIIVGGVGFGFYPPVRMSIFFGYGWHGWAGWGWHPGWRNRTVIVNNAFIHRYNFNEAKVENLHGTTVWAHDPAHRVGVPYSTAALRSQYRATVRTNLAAPGERMPSQYRSPNEPTERMGDRNVPQNAPAANRSVFSGYENGHASEVHSDHGYSSLGPQRSQPAPQQQQRSAPPPQQRSAPAPQQHSAPAAHSDRDKR